MINDEQTFTGPLYVYVNVAVTNLVKVSYPNHVGNSPPKNV